MQDDNLGYVICSISELFNAEIEPRDFIDFESRKRFVFPTRVYTHTAKFTSSRADTSNIKITFQVINQ
jgi:hypothetical protein